jgi:SPP1 family predicted phage head-tail adaptor
MGIRAGLLTETVTLLQAVTQRDGFGSESTEWTDAGTARARAMFRSGSRGVENGEIWNAVTVDFELRRFANVEGGMRIRWNGKDYHVVSVDYEPRHQRQVVRCELVNP